MNQSGGGVGLVGLSGSAQRHGSAEEQKRSWVGRLVLRAPCRLESCSPD